MVSAGDRRRQVASADFGKMAAVFYKQERGIENLPRAMILLHLGLPQHSYILRHDRAIS